MMSKKGYFEFLKSFTGEKFSEEYSFLLRRLYDTEFYSLVPNDDNRGEDGKRLRDIFTTAYGYDCTDIPDGPCNMLEMLFGLSDRLTNELLNSNHEKSFSDCFKLLLDNLQLLVYSNDFCATYPITSADNFMKAVDDIDNVISTFLDRKYLSNGCGGLFPLKNPTKDQRKVEIWYQMQAYILENYSI